MAAAGSWIKRRRRLLGVFAVVALLGVGIYYALRPAPQLARGPAGRFGGNVMPVNAAKVERGEIPIVVDALGQVVPLSTVTVRPQVTGYITEILFKEGQEVKEGDILAKIDDRQYRFTLEQSQGQLARDQAQLRNAELDLERYRNLLKEESIARQQVDTQEALVRQMRGTVQATTGTMDNARLNVERTSIRAPQSGRIGLRTIDEGNYISAGDAGGIGVITQTKPISVLFPIPEDKLASVIARVRAGATLEVTAYDRGKKNKITVGKLSTVDNRIDTTTGTVRLRAEFPNDDEKLFPNQFVNVELLVDTLKDVNVVPVTAIQRGAPGEFVYVVGADNKVSIRPVKTGPGTAEKVLIETGVETGDTVVTEGADRLAEGSIVLLPGQAPTQEMMNRAGGPGGRQGGRPGGGGPPGGRRGPPGGGGGF